MQARDMIPLLEFCRQTRIEVSFVHALEEHGLVDLTAEQDTFFLAIEQLPRLERMVRLHYELEINLEGIEAIIHMLHRISGMQERLSHLERELMRYQQP